MPSIVLLELRYGIVRNLRIGENAVRPALLRSPVAVLECDEEDAEKAGGIRAALERAGTPIGPCDTLIVVQARRRGAVLVMAATREFARVPGLPLEDRCLP